MNVLLLGLALMTASGPRAELEARDVSALQFLTTQVANSFNASDALTAAMQWSNDGTLITPAGEYGEGRANVEKLVQKGLATMLKGTHSTMSVQRILPITADLAFLDVQHVVTGMQRSDGTVMPELKIHVSLVVVREGHQWLILHARPNQMQPASASFE